VSFSPFCSVSRLAALLALTSGAGCTTLIPGTTRHDVRRDATKLEHDRCDATPVDPRIYSAEIVQQVAVHYDYVMGGPSGREARFGGAELQLRPLPGVTAELLERGLMCRSAQRMLGRVPVAPNEPYYLPDGWVKIDVRSGGGTFIVSLSAEDAAHGRAIYERARAFVGPSVVGGVSAGVP
jgi:hypothetical protein